MPVNGTPYSGHWGSIAGIQAKYGRENTLKAVDPDTTNDAVYIASRYEAALTQADNRITLRAAELRVAIPAVGTLTPYTLYFSEFANIYAGAWLSSGRGQPLEDGFNEFGEYQAMVNAAEKRLVSALIASRDLDSPSVSFGPNGTSTPSAAFGVGCNGPFYVGPW